VQEEIFLQSGFGAAKLAAPNPDFCEANTGLIFTGYISLFIQSNNLFPCAIQSTTGDDNCFPCHSITNVLFRIIILDFRARCKMIHSGSQKRKKRPKYYQSYGGLQFHANPDHHLRANN